MDNLTVVIQALQSYCKPFFSFKKLLLYLIGFLVVATFLTSVKKFEKIGPKSVCHPKNKIAFLKTHKCASSTFQNMLFRYGLKNNLTFALPELGNYFSQTRFRASLVTASKWNNPHIDIYAIHTKWNFTEMEKLMPDDTIFFTIIREPTELFESLFSYVGLGKSLGMNLDEYVSSHQINGPRQYGYIGYNQMAYDFGLPNDNFTQKTLMKMMPLWDEHFDLVLVADRIDESLVLLRHLLCWDLQDIIILKLNSRTEKHKIHLTPSTRFKLQHRLRYDYILYDHYITRFSKAVMEFGEERMAKEVKELREATKQLTERCRFQKKDSRYLRGGNKPWSEKVSGYQTNTKNESCIGLIRAENSFIQLLLHRQKLKHGLIHPNDINKLPMGAIAMRQDIKQKRVPIRLKDRV